MGSVMQASTVAKAVLALLFSLCLHGGIMGMFFMFSAGSRVETERIYHVALADFALPGIAREAPAPEVPEPAVETPPPAPEEVIHSSPAPTPEPLREPEIKAISAAKPAPPVRARPAAKPIPQPAQALREQSPTPVQAASGPRPRQFGGFSAYDQEQVDQRPSISSRVEPEYPARARRMNVEGTVVVELVVDTGGLPKACAVHSAEPPGYFEKAALNAAQRLRFIPGKLDGRPVNTLVRLPFVFRLR